MPLLVFLGMFLRGVTDQKLQVRVDLRNNLKTRTPKAVNGGLQTE